MFDNHLIETILAQPDAHFVLTTVQDALQKEQANRKKFYEQVTENVKMEFINGEIVMQSPVTLFHNLITGRAYILIKTYVMLNNLGIVGVEKLLIRLTRNDYEPDICFFGNTKTQEFTDNQKLFPAPDFVVEVLSPSTIKTDRETKFIDYARHQIAEYWIIDPEKQFLEQYCLAENGEYELNLKAKEGIVKSIAIPNFNLSINALFDDQDIANELQKLMNKR
jgi:Uma2 family endonuclease